MLLPEQGQLSDTLYTNLLIVVGALILGGRLESSGHRYQDKPCPPESQVLAQLVVMPCDVRVDVVPIPLASRDIYVVRVILVLLVQKCADCRLVKLAEVVDLV